MITFKFRRSLFHFAPDHGGTGISSDGGPPPFDADLPLQDAEPGAFGEMPDASALAQSDIAARAHEIWEAEGQPHGRADDHWRQAEEDLRKRKVSMPDIGARQ